LLGAVFLIVMLTLMNVYPQLPSSSRPHNNYKYC
jgi:hypothetical protein